MPCSLTARMREAVCCPFSSCCSSETCALDGRYQSPFLASLFVDVYIALSCPGYDGNNTAHTAKRVRGPPNRVSALGAAHRYNNSCIQFSCPPPPPRNCMGVQVLARHEGANTLLDVMDLGLADEASASYLPVFGYSTVHSRGTIATCLLLLLCTSVGPSLRRRGA